MGRSSCGASGASVARIQRQERGKEIDAPQRGIGKYKELNPPGLAHKTLDWPVNARDVFFQTSTTNSRYPLLFLFKFYQTVADKS